MKPQDKAFGSAPEERLKTAGITLPSPPRPLGSYSMTVQVERLLFLSGILPFVNGKAAHLGCLGVDLDESAGREAARVAAINALSVAQAALGTLNRIQHVVRLVVYMAACADFTEHAKVADSASDTFAAVFGRDQMPVRSVIGAASLPKGMSVELELTLLIDGLGNEQNPMRPGLPRLTT